MNESLSFWLTQGERAVDLFVDHSRIVQLECLRRGIWGTQDVFGRIHTYREKEREAPEP